MTTALFTHPACGEAEVPAGHPERAPRLGAILDQLHARGLYDMLEHVDAAAATRAQLARAHTQAHIDRIERGAPADGMVSIDADTFMGPHTLDAARRAAGACVQATDLVLQGQVDNAFCCVRPPGHHAGRDHAMGFCLFNNVAVAALHALEHHGVERVVILDFDVHHGNGTEDIVRDEPRILLCSTFQHPFYPHSGADSRARNVVNVPLAAGTTGTEFRNAILDRWQPAVERFAPRCVFVSAGFDAHADDPLGGLALTEGDYRWVSEWLLQQAARHADGRVVSTLEGGYDLGALGRSAAAHVAALLG